MGLNEGIREGWIGNVKVTGVFKGRVDGCKGKE